MKTTVHSDGGVAMVRSHAHAGQRRALVNPSVCNGNENPPRSAAVTSSVVPPCANGARKVGVGRRRGPAAVRRQYLRPGSNPGQPPPRGQPSRRTKRCHAGHEQRKAQHRRHDVQLRDSDGDAAGQRHREHGDPAYCRIGNLGDIALHGLGLHHWPRHAAYSNRAGDAPAQPCLHPPNFFPETPPMPKPGPASRSAQRHRQPPPKARGWNRRAPKTTTPATCGPWRC